MVNTIKEINGVQWPADQVAFYEAFIAGTSAIPDKKTERLWRDEDGVGTVMLDVDTAVMGVVIENAKAKPSGEGYGQKATRWVVDLADKHNVSLFIDLVPEHVSVQRLKDWAKSFGFKPNGGISMRYTPPAGGAPKPR